MNLIEERGYPSLLGLTQVHESIGREQVISP